MVPFIPKSFISNENVIKPFSFRLFVMEIPDISPVRIEKKSLSSGKRSSMISCLVFLLKVLILFPEKNTVLKERQYAKLVHDRLEKTAREEARRLKDPVGFQDEKNRAANLDDKKVKITKKEIKEYKLRVNFSQGLNIRIISKKQAQALASVEFRNLNSTKKQVTFAWDQINDEKVIKRGFQRVVDAGIKPYQMQFYVLIGYDTTPEEDLHRVMMVKGWGCDPYAMPYDKTNPYQKKFVRWVNRRAIFKSCSWEEYTGNVRHNKLEYVL